MLRDFTFVCVVLSPVPNNTYQCRQHAVGSQLHIIWFDTCPKCKAADLE